VGRGGSVPAAARARKGWRAYQLARWLAPKAGLADVAAGRRALDRGRVEPGSRRIHANVFAELPRIARTGDPAEHGIAQAFRNQEAHRLRAMSPDRLGCLPATIRCALLWGVPGILRRDPLTPIWCRCTHVRVLGNGLFRPAGSRIDVFIFDCEFGVRPRPTNEAAHPPRRSDHEAMKVGRADFGLDSDLSLFSPRLSSNPEPFVARGPGPSGRSSRRTRTEPRRLNLVYV